MIPLMSPNREHTAGYYRTKDIATGTLYHASRPLRFLGNTARHSAGGLAKGAFVGGFFGAVDYYSFFSDPKFEENVQGPMGIMFVIVSAIAAGGAIRAALSIPAGMIKAWDDGSDRNMERYAEKQREKAQRRYKKT